MVSVLVVAALIQGRPFLINLYLTLDFVYFHLVWFHMIYYIIVFNRSNVLIYAYMRNTVWYVICGWLVGSCLTGAPLRLSVVRCRMLPWVQVRVGSGLNSTVAQTKHRCTARVLLSRVWHDGAGCGVQMYICQFGQQWKHLSLLQGISHLPQVDTGNGEFFSMFVLSRRALEQTLDQNST